MSHQLESHIKIFVTRLAFACLVFFMPPGVSAQKLHGVVQDDTGIPLPGVHVVLVGLDQGTITDNEGTYDIALTSAGVYKVSFSFVGFRTHTDSVLVEQTDIRLDVVLDPDVLTTEELVITENRADALMRDSRAVSILEPEDLDELRGQTLGETLEELPGITTLQTGPSIAKPVVRGLHSQRVLVLNAGVSQEGQQWGGEHAPEIDPFAPVRIEVIKGVAGVEYGVGAIGGVISLEPLDLPYVPGHGVDGQLSLNGFSNNLQGAGALYLEGTVDRFPGVGWRVQGSLRKAGDTHAPNYTINNSAFQEFNGSASVGLRRERTVVVGHFSHFGTDLGIFTGAHIGNINDLLRAIDRGHPSMEADFSYDIGTPKQSIAHNLFTVHADHHMASGHTVEARYGLQSNRRQEFDAHGRGEQEDTSPAFDLSLISQSLEFKFQHNPIGNWVGVVGVTGMNQLNRNDASGFLIPNFRALSSGAFARESWVGEDITIEAGIRFDYRWVRAWPRENGSRGPFVERITDYASLSGVLGTVWEFAPAWSFGVNLGTGWRPPSVNELYNFGVHHGTAQFEIGNPDLESERSIGLDATLRHNGSRGAIEFSAYSNTFEKFIYLFPGPEPRVTIRGTFPTFRYEQADATLRGMELSLEYHVSRRVTVGLQGSLIRGDNRDTKEPLFQMPGDRLIGRVELGLGSSGLFEDASIGFESIAVRKQTRFPENVDYADPPDGYMLLNADFSTKLKLNEKHVSVNLAVQNAFNTVYRDYLSRFRYFIDDPGRSFIFRVQIPIGRPH